MRTTEGSISGNEVNARIAVIAFFLVWVLPFIARGGSLAGAEPPAASAPSIQGLDAIHEGPYMVRQLASFSDRYWARVAGRDTGLPPQVNGHDEFADRWTREMLDNLRGLPAGVVRQQFTTPGFRRLPASRPGVNIVIAVPGSQNAAEAVIVGAHYDGEPTSRGSAYDDTSGCMIVLALARDLGRLWRRDGPPALTVEFVLFDAEEQGLIGSTAYGFAYREGAVMPRPMLMIDEEQSGVGYPVRPFGLLSSGPLPSFALTTGQVAPSRAQTFGGMRAPKGAALALLDLRLTAARHAAFGALRTAFPSLAYRGGKAQVFTAAEERDLQIARDSPAGCCSDNGPFEALGLPTVMLVGDFSYYNRAAQPWAFPYDQPQDTLQMLACDTGGEPNPGHSLQAALDLPLSLSEALVATYAPPAAGSNIAVFSTVAGHGAPVQLIAVGVGPVRWSFGDGTRGTGKQVTHVYSRAGVYGLTVRAGTGTSSWRLAVRTRQPLFVSRFHDLNPPPVKSWRPEALQGVTGCH